MALARQRFAHVAIVFLVGCGSRSNGGTDAGICPIRDNPTFELGTGEDRFLPLVDGQSLRMAPGEQGGCHFWLAVRTQGFAPRLFDIRYELFFADDNQSTGSASSKKVSLRASTDTPGTCEYFGYTAYIVGPPRLVGRRIRIDVTVQDDLGRSATLSRNVVAEWPESNPERCDVP